MDVRSPLCVVDTVGSSGATIARTIILSLFALISHHIWYASKFKILYSRSLCCHQHIFNGTMWTLNPCCSYLFAGAEFNHAPKNARRYTICSVLSDVSLYYSFTPLDNICLQKDKVSWRCRRSGRKGLHKTKQRYFAAIVYYLSVHYWIHMHVALSFHVSQVSKSRENTPDIVKMNRALQPCHCQCNRTIWLQKCILKLWCVIATQSTPYRAILNHNFLHWWIIKAIGILGLLQVIFVWIGGKRRLVSRIRMTVRIV